MYGGGYGWERRQKGYWWSILQLVGHLLGTGVIFVTFFSLVWVVGFAFNWLHAIDPFPDEVFNLVRRFKMGLLYADALVSGVVFAAGMWRFCKDVMR